MSSEVREQGMGCGGACPPIWAEIEVVEILPRVFAAINTCFIQSNPSVLTSHVFLSGIRKCLYDTGRDTKSFPRLELHKHIFHIKSCPWFLTRQ